MAVVAESDQENAQSRRSRCLLGLSQIGVGRQTTASDISLKLCGDPERLLNKACLPHHIALFTFGASEDRNQLRSKVTNLLRLCQRTVNNIGTCRAEEHNYQTDDDGTRFQIVAGCGSVERFRDNIHMIWEAIHGRWRRGDVFDRAALRFALNARPTASQGEAPAGAIENMRILESVQKGQYKVGFEITPTRGIIAG